jgi:hypothetical protein
MVTGEATIDLNEGLKELIHILGPNPNPRIPNGDRHRLRHRIERHAHIHSTMIVVKFDRWGDTLSGGHREQ